MSENTQQPSAAPSQTSAAPSQPTLVGPQVTLRDPRESDTDALLGYLLEPEVSEWWTEYTRERVLDELIRSSVARTIEVDGEPAGSMFVLRGDDPEYPTTVMHIFLGTRWRGRSIGAEALALAIRHEFSEGISRVTLDPHVGNAPAIRSYERLGFKRIGILRDYQLRPDGSYADALFLDLTRRDFPEGPELPAPH